MNCALRYVFDEKQGRNVLAGTIDNIPQGVFVPFTGYDEETGKGYVTPISAFKELVRGYTLDGYVHETTPLGYFDFIETPPGNSIVPYDWDKLTDHTKATIMKHQRDAVNIAIMEHGYRSIFAAAPGSGKTLPAILVAFNVGGSCLMIVPTNKVKDWYNEIGRWTGTDKKIQIIKNCKDKITASIVICSIDRAKNHEEILNTKWNCVIVDECHTLKNTGVKRSDAIIPLLKAADAVMMLSGTPQESRTCELFNQLHALHPAVFNDRRVFTARYSNGHYDRFHQWVEIGSRNLDELHVVLSKCMFRVTSDVMVDLPGLQRFKVNVDTQSKKHQKLISDIRTEQQAIYQEQRAQNDEKKHKLLEMQRNVLGNKLWALSGTIKTLVCKEFFAAIMSKHHEENIIFFAFHKRAVDACTKIMHALIPEKERVIVVNADVPEDKRQGMLAPLQEVNKEKPKYGVLSIKTCGTGINLCPGVSVIVFLEMDRTPSQMIQAEARARRKGAIRNISSYWLVLKQGNDNMNLDRLQTRKEANSRVIDGVRADQFEFDYTIDVVYTPKEGEEEEDPLAEPAEAAKGEEEEEEAGLPKRKKRKLT